MTHAPSQFPLRSPIKSGYAVALVGIRILFFGTILLLIFGGCFALFSWLSASSHGDDLYTFSALIAAGAVGLTGLAMLVGQILCCFAPHSDERNFAIVSIILLIASAVVSLGGSAYSSLLKDEANQSYVILFSVIQTLLGLISFHYFLAYCTAIGQNCRSRTIVRSTRLTRAAFACYIIAGIVLVILIGYSVNVQNSAIQYLTLVTLILAGAISLWLLIGFMVMLHLIICEVRTGLIGGPKPIAGDETGFSRAGELMQAALSASEGTDAVEVQPDEKDKAPVEGMDEAGVAFIQSNPDESAKSPKPTQTFSVKKPETEQKQLSPINPQYKTVRRGFQFVYYSTACGVCGGVLMFVFAVFGMMLMRSEDVVSLALVGFLGWSCLCAIPFFVGMFFCMATPKSLERTSLLISLVLFLGIIPVSLFTGYYSGVQANDDSMNVFLGIVIHAMNFLGTVCFVSFCYEVGRNTSSPLLEKQAGVTQSAFVCAYLVFGGLIWWTRVLENEPSRLMVFIFYGLLAATFSVAIGFAVAFLNMLQKGIRELKPRVEVTANIE